MHVDGMRANSLALRLFLSATAWAVIILLITGVVLSSLYRQAVERAFDRRLGVYSAHAGGGRRFTGRGRRKISAVARRTAVRIAAVRLVLAGDPAGSCQNRGASVALALGRRPATFARLWDRSRAKWLARGLCARAGRSATPPG